MSSQFLQSHYRTHSVASTEKLRIDLRCCCAEFFVPPRTLPSTASHCWSNQCSILHTCLFLIPSSHSVPCCCSFLRKLGRNAGSMLEVNLLQLGIVPYELDGMWTLCLLTWNILCCWTCWMVVKPTSHRPASRVSSWETLINTALQKARETHPIQRLRGVKKWNRS